jgi:F-type H+-transporting ATPase subunit gamma
LASLKDLRNKIKSIKSIQQVTNAMKMVAAAKLRKSQEDMEKARPYTNSIEEMINHLIPDIDRSLLSILETREVKKKLFIVVSADRGMAGAFNSNIIKKTEQKVLEFGNEDSLLICIGKKSHDYFKRRDFNIIKSYRDFWNTLDVSDALSIGDMIVEKYLSKEIDSVEVIYNEFISVASQKIICKTFLPITYDHNEKESCDLLYEPSKAQVVKTLVPKHLNVQLWQFLLESNASEQAARMVAMENATDNAGEMISDLSIEYNKARQAAITTEIIEIVSGANALEG